MSDAPPSPPGPPPGEARLVSVGAALRTAARARWTELAAAMTRTGMRGRRAAGGAAALALVVATGATIWLARDGSSDAKAEVAPPPVDLAKVAIGPCRGPALPSTEGADRSLVTGTIEGGSVLEVLRARALGPDEVYRVRQAFQDVPGWAGVTRGRFVVALRREGSAVERVDLFVSPDEAYRARLDASGKLVGSRVEGGVPVRLCHATVRLTREGLAASLEVPVLSPELAPALRAAFAGRVDLETSDGAELRVIARELDAGEIFAGYDGIAAAEVRVGEASAGDVTTVRGYGAVDDADRAALDARLASITWSEPVVATSAADPEGDDEADDDEDEEPPPDPKLTVEQAARKSCSTRIVAGLSRQIIAESRCLDPDAFVRVPKRKNLVTSSTVFLYLVAPARDRLLRVLDAHPDATMTVNSALRTVAQQVLLSKWGATRRCGVPLAAKPGESNHETGLALDVKESATWRKALEAEGFTWMGKKDPVHFDYAGPKAKDHRGLDVRAFQRLWTRNHPDDAIAETGKVDAKTAARLAKAPAAGFPIGARCER